MYKSAINYQIGLFFKQIEYRYITFKNNRAVERAFVYNSQITPFSRTVAFTKDHSLLMALFATGLISMSLMVLLKPISFTKPVSLRLEIDREIEKKLVNIPPPHFLEKKEVTTTLISQANFLNKTPNFTLLINKHTKKLLVTEEKENGYLVIEEFPVSLGINPGDKNFEGDMKTPEGTYSLIDLKMDDELPDQYGPYAAVLNYPNKEDLKHGKTGSGIWIHGTGKNQLTPDTQGCVELSDKNLIKLYSYISKGTKIIITPENIDITPKKSIVKKNLISLAAAS